jgi:hypothetical protein
MKAVGNDSESSAQAIVAYDRLTRVFFLFVLTYYEAAGIVPGWIELRGRVIFFLSQEVHSIPGGGRLTLARKKIRGVMSAVATDHFSYPWLYHENQVNAASLVLQSQALQRVLEPRFRAVWESPDSTTTTATSAWQIHK